MAYFEHSSFGEGKQKKERFDPILEKLWRDKRFMGDPPRKGSPAEERLRATCERYAQYITNPSLRRDPQSDTKRRDLHNEIAIMVLGIQRSGMDNITAENIADFACILTTGCTVREAEDYGAEREIPV